MTPVVVVATGSLVLSLAVLVWSLRPVPTAIRSVRRLVRTGGDDDRGSSASASLDDLWVTAGRRFPGVTAELERWLRITDSSLATLARQVVVGGAAGGVTVTVVAVAATVGLGAGAAPVPGLALVAVGAAAGMVVPVTRLRRRADQARRQASRAVGTTLDLVLMCLAGGMGIEGALQAACAVGDDPFSQRLSTVLAAAATAGAAPWDRMVALGEALGVPDLVDLGAVIALAGTEGARVRATLAAKADALRTRQLADEEAAANTVTERMFLPGVLLLLGFLLFIGYPAVARILSGL